MAGRCAGRAFDRVDRRLVGLHRVPGELGCPTPGGSILQRPQRRPELDDQRPAIRAAAPLSAAAIGRPALQRRITSSGDIVTLSDHNARGTRALSRRSARMTGSKLIMVSAVRWAVLCAPVMCQTI